jgi:hypothetical protein
MSQFNFPGAATAVSLSASASQASTVTGPQNVAVQMIGVKKSV